MVWSPRSSSHSLAAGASSSTVCTTRHGFSCAFAMSASLMCFVPEARSVGLAAPAFDLDLHQDRSVFFEMKHLFDSMHERSLSSAGPGILQQVHHARV